MHFEMGARHKSESCMLKSYRSDSSSKLKLKLPVNSKLSYFFTRTTSRSNGLPKSQTKLIKKSLSSQVTLLPIQIMKQKATQDKIRETDNFYYNQQSMKNQQLTRSRLTVYDDYGMAPKVETQSKKHFCSPKTPKNIYSKSGKNIIIFPMLQQKKLKKPLNSKSKSKLNTLEYTFGLKLQ